MAYTTINDPTSYYETRLYTGTGETVHQITNFSAKPDLLWFKERNSTSTHQVYDTTRGASKELDTTGNAAEATNGDALEGFRDYGFQVDNDAGINEKSNTYVVWSWNANGGTTSSNTSGSITSTVQANTTSGFSIVSYVGVGSSTVSTIGHSLGAVPDMIIIKTRSDTESWNVYHQAMGNTKKLFLDTTGAQADTGNFDDTSPTSTLFTVTGDQINDDSDNVIAYCFTPIQGYSKFGSYEGNGNADGPFVYTGFSPSFLLYKNSDDGARNWNINDIARSTFNPRDDYILPNLNNAEGQSDAVDFLSNGFKLRSTDAGSNDSAETIIYAAFAESPFVTSNGVSTNAQ